MASFTDKAPQFNPYIQQLPVDAMVKVGMEKQKRYDEGIQKIQTQIDNIAGLDIMRDIDKNYLQSKLNELGNNLKTVAAGDFSNYQLVNSVSGMTNQIIKDDNIKNAVASTAWYRDQVAQMKDAQSKGNSDPANEDLFMTQANSWMNDGQVGSKFSSSYIPYTDVFKKLQEIAKSVGEDSTIVQQLFITDANGNPVLKDGKLQYNDVMAETLLKGKDKNKLLQAFQTGLSATDYRQLGISGRYNLKGKTKDELMEVIDNSWNSYEKSITQQKEFINNKILELKTSNGSQEDIDNLEKSKLALDNNLEKRRQEIINTKSMDLDAIRGSIYTNNFLDTLSDSFSSKETYTKYSKNPAVEMMLDRERLRIQAAAENRQMAEFQYKKEQDVNQMNFEWKKELFKAGLIDANGRPTGNGRYSQMRDIPLTDLSATYFTDKFDEGLNSDMDKQKSLYEKVAIAHWMAYNSLNDPRTGKPYTVEETKRNMAIYAKKMGMSYDEYVILQGKKAKDYYYSNNNSLIGSEYAPDFEQIDNLERSISLKSAQMKKSDEYVKNNSQDFTPIDLNKVDFNGTSVLDVATGRSINLNKQDMLDFAAYTYHTKHDAGMPRFLDSDAVKKQADIAYKRLSSKYGAGTVASLSNQLYGSTFGPLDIWHLDVARGQNPELTKALKVVMKANYTKTAQLKEEYFKSIGEIGVPKTEILLKDKENPDRLAKSVASVAGDYVGIDSDYSNFSAGAAEDGTTFEVNVDPTAATGGTNSYTLKMTKKNGEVLEKPIQENQYLFLTGRTQAPMLFMDGIGAAINSFGTNSTNSTYSYMDPNNASSTAFVKQNSFPYVRQNIIAMDFAKGSSPKSYYPKIYVKQGNNWKLLQYNRPLSEEDAKNFPLVIDDNLINSLLRK